MIGKRFYTFVVASYPGSKIWRLSLSSPRLLSIAIVAVIALLAAGVALQDYIEMRSLVADYNRVIAENDTFRSENQNYRIQTAQLGEKIEYLETIAQQVTVLSGMNSNEAPGGVGGFSNESFNKPLPLSGGTIQAIDGYNKSVTDLEKEYRGLKEYLSERALVAASTPAFLPLRGYVTANMGVRHDPFNQSLTDYHTGIDISAPYGSRVIAPADGTIIFAGRRAGYGNIVVIDHKFGVMTRYGHLWKFNVEAGDRVSRNDVIGYVGTTGRTTGPHLHFELWLQNRPVNPLKYFRNLERRNG